jgi:hypothetical protein
MAGPKLTLQTEVDNTKTKQGLEEFRRVVKQTSEESENSFKKTSESIENVGHTLGLISPELGEIAEGFSGAIGKVDAFSNILKQIFPQFFNINKEVEKLGDNLKGLSTNANTSSKGFFGNIFSGTSVPVIVNEKANAEQVLEKKETGLTDIGVDAAIAGSGLSGIGNLTASEKLENVKKAFKYRINEEQFKAYSVAEQKRINRGFKKITGVDIGTAIEDQEKADALAKEEAEKALRIRALTPIGTTSAGSSRLAGGSILGVVGIADLVLIGEAYKDASEKAHEFHEQSEKLGINTDEYQDLIALTKK